MNIQHASWLVANQLESDCQWHVYIYRYVTKRDLMKHRKTIKKHHKAGRLTLDSFEHLDEYIVKRLAEVNA